MRKGGRPLDARPLSPYGEVLRRDLLDLHVAHAGDRAARVDEADLAEELTARRCGRPGGTAAGTGGDAAAPARAVTLPETVVEAPVPSLTGASETVTAPRVLEKNTSW